jgi:hypothetical protein
MSFGQVGWIHWGNCDKNDIFPIKLLVLLDRSSDFVELKWTQSVIH